MGDESPEDFARRHARTENLATSKIAARTLREQETAAIKAKILAAIARSPSTFSEVAVATGLNESQVWKRISDLKNDGSITPTGLTRPGPSGRQQTVWGIQSKS